jgi:hypothetical protein
MYQCYYHQNNSSQYIFEQVGKNSVFFRYSRSIILAMIFGYLLGSVIDVSSIRMRWIYISLIVISVSRFSLNLIRTDKFGSFTLVTVTLVGCYMIVGLKQVNWIFSVLGGVIYLFAQVFCVQDKRNHVIEVSQNTSEVRLFTVQNSTMKRIKLCLYHRWDYCCWLPLGGIAGKYVRYLYPGESTEYRGIDKTVKLKVFSPCLLDEELARCNISQGEIAIIKDINQRIFRGRIESGMRQRRSSMSKKTKSFDSLVDLVGEGIDSNQGTIDGVEILNATLTEIKVDFYEADAVSFIFPGLSGWIAPDSKELFPVSQKMACIEVSSDHFGKERCIVEYGNSYTVTDGLI